MCVKAAITEMRSGVQERFHLTLAGESWQSSAHRGVMSGSQGKNEYKLCADTMNYPMVHFKRLEDESISFPDFNLLINGSGFPEVALRLDRWNWQTFGFGVFFSFQCEHKVFYRDLHTEFVLL